MPRTTHFNYRVTVQRIDGEEDWAVRELYYDSNGNVVLWSKDPIGMAASTYPELVAELNRFVEAMAEPVFDLDAQDWRRGGDVA
jgi:hypothetical protein